MSKINLSPNSSSINYYGKGGSSDGENVFMVTVEVTANEYGRPVVSSVDKTFDEIVAAFEANKQITAKLAFNFSDNRTGARYLPLYSVFIDEQNESRCVFSVSAVMERPSIGVSGSAYIMYDDLFVTFDHINGYGETWNYLPYVLTVEAYASEVPSDDGGTVG